MFKKNNPLRNFRIACESEVKEVTFDTLKENIDFSHYDTIFDNIQQKYVGETIYGLYVKDKLLGVACVNKSYSDPKYIPNKAFFISAVEIDNKHRGQGYGRNFVRELEGIAHLECYSEVWMTPLLEALPYWAELGYEEVKDTKYWRKLLNV